MAVSPQATVSQEIERFIEKHRDVWSRLSDGASTAEAIVDAALKEHHAHAIADSVNASGRYHTPLWSFVRAIRSFYAEEVEADAVFDELEPEIIRRGGWGVLGTGLTDEAVYLEFACNWSSIRYRSGETPLENALGKAERFPLTPDRAIGHPRLLIGYSRFVSIAAWLQVTMGDRPIFLPVRNLACLLEVAEMSISRYRQMAEEDGYIRTLQPACRERHRATKFRFDISRFEILLRHSQPGTREGFSSDPPRANADAGRKELARRAGEHGKGAGAKPEWGRRAADEEQGTVSRRR